MDAARDVLTDVLTDLREVVGSEHVLTDADVVRGYVSDWSGRFVGHTPAVVRPGSVTEVSEVLALCRTVGIAVVPQGGNTGLVGGGVPLHGELVLSLRRLDALDEVDAHAGQVTAQAGVTLARLQEHARAAGWDYGVDLGARESATVGGMVATNAGGVRVLRHGSTRRQVVGIEAVLADGRVFSRLDGLEKDNTGYDLAGLLCGSEGTLAVITAARLRLVPLAEHVVVALLAFDTIDATLDAIAEMRRRIESLQAVEFFLQDGLDLVCERLRCAPPFGGKHAGYVLVECAASVDPTDALAAAVNAIDGVADVAVASDSERRKALWRYREGHTEAINMLGVPHKLDVALPLERFGAFIARVPDRIAEVAPSAGVWLFGHAADGNVHVNVTGVSPDDDTVTEAVLQLVAELHGSISAEHGIGTAKRAWIHLTRTPEELALFGALKHALDPRGILNPHVILPEVPADDSRR